MDGYKLATALLEAMQDSAAGLYELVPETSRVKADKYMRVQESVRMVLADALDMHRMMGLAAERSTKYQALQLERIQKVLK